MKQSVIKYLLSVRKRLYIIIFETDTRVGRLFDIILLWAILLSVFGVMLESVKEIKQPYGTFLLMAEWAFTILFTIEYLLRLFISRSPGKYAFSFLGIIDLLALLPSYITLFVSGGSYLIVIRSIRLLRVFRILKLGRYLREASVLTDALTASRHKILVFLGAVTTLVLITGTLMYMIEGSGGGFTSIPRSIYWAIVTVTTVGYGDIAPQTIIGQITASILMLMGYAIIAVPTGIVTSEIVNAEKGKIKEENQIICSSCGLNAHDPDAKFCKSCGNKLS
ncbi:MAG: ion transporter [Ekhidna sp.]|nr:ion transporter [Ekhidna sp.]MBC6411161.1 ion transporter [Ekhidna sp.]